MEQTRVLPYVEWYEENVHTPYPGNGGELSHMVMARIADSIPEYLNYLLSIKGVIDFKDLNNQQGNAN